MKNRKRANNKKSHTTTLTDVEFVLVVTIRHQEKK